MARFALAWEFGGGLGHAVPLAQLAQALLMRGHEVHLVWKDLALVETLLGTEPSRLVHLWQAPLSLHRLRGAPGAVSYAEVLLESGYHEPATMRVLVRAWRKLLTVIGPDLLIADHAPSALLAARGLPLARAMFGNGFMIPPACRPMPPFREWEATAPERLTMADERALLVCNQLLESLGEPALDAFHELLDVDEHFLLGWPELDHYQRDRVALPLTSWGWPGVLQVGADPVWPTATGPRVLVYLTREHPSYDAVVACLRSGPWCSLMVILGASNEEMHAGSNSRLQIVNRPIDMASAFAAADVLLSHSGSGLLYQAMAAGLPSVLLPAQVEQLLLARRVVSAGAGILLWPHEVEHSLARAIAAVVGSTGFATATRQLAARNSAAVHGDVMARIATRCEALSGSAR